MDSKEFPRLCINLRKLKSNILTMKEKCESIDITVSGVVKGTNGLTEVIQTFVDAGMNYLASSRLNQLKKIKEISPNSHTLALRLPMLSELKDLINYADCSLNSEIKTLKKLEEVCRESNIKHEVLLMHDLGDLREGFFQAEELYQAAEFVENECHYLQLKGIGTNLGCYGSIEPDSKNLGQLICHAEKIEGRIGRQLEWISGGATTTIPLVLNGTIPERINHLRIGDGIYLRDMEMYFDYTFEEMYPDVFVLEGEIIEIHDKPSYPIGTISVDAFGNRPEYIDLGIRKRALLAMGRQDIGDMTKLLPLDRNVQIMGGSSDHTIIDITDSDYNYKLGDTMSFHIQYENLLFTCISEYVNKIYIRE